MQTATKTLKIPADVHARLKRASAAPTPPESVGDFGTKLIVSGLDAIDAKNARKAKKGAAS